MSAATPPPPMPGQERSYEVEWTTISYRAIMAYAILALLALGLVLYLIAPRYFGQKLKQGLGAITAGLGRTTSTEAAAAKREAHFVNIDGTVRVKKAQSLQWISADYNTNLENGDYIQTGSDGVARIIFADGTNYLLKPDSLIVVEESREDPVTKATRVAVQVSSGAVDLSTGKFEVPGSTSRVSFENATANLAEDSRAMLRNDPRKDVHELTVEQGQASVTRGSTTVQLGQYDQVTFNREKPGLTRLKVISPPLLEDPPNMALTMTKDPKAANLDFAWSHVPGAVAYRLQISPSGMFSNLVVDRSVAGRTSARVTGLEEGTYYWVVSSIDAKGVESQPSAANRFSLVQQVEAGSQAFLEVTGIVQHGRVLEVVGRTEPGSTVIINNEQVFSIAADGTFRHFTSPLAKTGANQITITAQNRKGGTQTIRKNIVVE
ncbi:MAG: hypothetical protein MUP80_13165 [Acidobacteriia bacterium]|nr:hypothetical protein [Terriglobia bacterium]